MITLRVHDVITVHEKLIEKLYNTRDYDKFAFEFGNILTMVIENIRLYPVTIEYKPNFEKDVLKHFEDDEEL